MTPFVQPKDKRRPAAAKLLAVALTTLTAASATFGRPLQGSLRAAGQARPSPALPVLTVAEAQRQVSFPLYVPREIPAGGAVTGVRVYEITLSDPQSVQATIRVNTKPITGYGLVWRYENHNIMVRSLPGSPAEKAGLSSRQAVPLVSVNGYEVQPAKDARHDRAFFARWEAMTEPERRAVRKRRPPLTLRLMARPLRLTVRDADGATRRITLARPERFTFRPEAPNAENAGWRAALLLDIAGRSVALLQSPPAKGKPALPENARRVQVNGKAVRLAGPQDAPSAFWREPGADMALQNPGVLSLPEVCRLVGSTQAFRP